MDGVLTPKVILVYAPTCPGIPFVVTPVLYCVPPVVNVPSGVSENLNGCPELEESDWSNVYVPPCKKPVKFRDLE